MSSPFSLLGHTINAVLSFTTTRYQQISFAESWVSEPKFVWVISSVRLQIACYTFGGFMLSSLVPCLANVIKSKPWTVLRLTHRVLSPLNPSCLIALNLSFDLLRLMSSLQVLLIFLPLSHGLLPGFLHLLSSINCKCQKQKEADRMYRS